jgi:polysaccharide pyruvyl transferase WcaK-like protein
MQETLLTMTPEAQEKQQKQIASCNLCIERLHALITALRGGIVSEIEAAENAMNTMK